MSTNVTEKYDDITNTWTTKKTTVDNRGRRGPFNLNGYGYVVGGEGLTATDKYDDILNTWTAKTTITNGRNYPAGFSIGNIKESIINPEITQILKSITRLRANESMIPKAASANLRNSHDAEVTTTSATYTKKKTINLPQGLIGTYTVKFDLKTSDITKTAYGRLYKNSPGGTATAIGAEQSEAGLVYSTKSENITNTLSPGETLELHLHNDGVGTTSAQNFRLYYDDSATVAVWSINS